MTGWKLPVTVTVGGQLFSIRSDFRAVLDALSALQAPDLTEQERRIAFLQIMYPRWKTLPDYQQAFIQAVAFINLGQSTDDRPHEAPLADWDTDAQLIAPAVDAVLGYSCRQCAYLHWWDFVGAYQSIKPDGLFGTVMRIRAKKRKGKKLDDAERAFARENPSLITPPHEKTEEELRLLALLGE